MTSLLLQLASQVDLGNQPGPPMLKESQSLTQYKDKNSVVLLINSEKSPYEKTLYGSHHADDKDSLVGKRDCILQGKKTCNKKPVKWI